MLKIKNSADSAEIYISGAIVDDDVGGCFESWGDEGTGYEWPKAIKYQLDAIDNDAPLTIYINSDGGSVPAGVAIANMIARHKGKTTAVVDGWACSIATQIFFAADERKISSNAYLMIHKPSTCVAGDANDFQKAIDALDVLQEGLETTYRNAAREGVSDGQIHQMVEDTTWLTGADAAELFNIELLEATQTAACASGSVRFKNMPKGINFADRKPVPEPQDADNYKVRAAIQLAIIEGEILDEKI